MVGSVYSLVIQVVKYLPIIVHLIIVFNMVDVCILGESYTDYLYPFIGHSLVFDILLYILSIAFKLCVWHRLLVINMVINAILEWITVNVVSSDHVYDVIALSALSTTLFILLAVISVFSCKR